MNNKQEEQAGYQPPEISDSQLRWGLWYVKHYRKLRIGLIIILLAVGGLSFIYGFYGIADYYFRGRLEDDAVLKNLSYSLINLEEVRKSAPLPLIFDLPLSFPASEEGNYDLALAASNPNERHWAEAEISFWAAGEEAGRGDIFLLPGEEKYLLLFNKKISGGTADLTVKINEVNWHHLDKHLIPDWPAFAAAHLDQVGYRDINFYSARLNDSGTDLDFNHLSFTVTNLTPFSYRAAEWQIIFHGGSGLVGVNNYLTDELISGQEKTIKLKWPGIMETVEEVEIIPSINIMDPAAYIKPASGEIIKDPREENNVK